MRILKKDLKKLKKLSAALMACLFILGLCHNFAQAKSLTANEIISRIVQQRTYLVSFQADAYLMLLDPKLLTAPTPARKTPYPLALQLRGTLNYSEELRFNLFLDSPEGTWHIKSLNANNIEFIRFIPKTSESLKTNINLPQSIALVFPPNLNAAIANQLFLLLNEEVIFDKFCYVLATSDGKYKIWVNKDDFSIYKVQIPDTDNGVITAYYKNFYAFEPSFTLYSSVEVLKNQNPLFSLSLVNPKINIPLRELRGYIPSPPPLVGKITPLNYEENFWEKLIRERFAIQYHPAPFFSFTQRIIFILLLLGLSYMLFREIRVRMQRPVFAKELIVIDNEDRKCTDLLMKMGYEVINFSPELLTEERKIVSSRGRKLLPRAVIAAPGAFGAIKSYLFLLRAYVEEGGRVLVLPQTSAYAHTLPFNSQFYPFNQYDESRVFFISRNNIWQRITTNEIENKTLF
jgi:hypothetical protein